MLYVRKVPASLGGSAPGRSGVQGDGSGGGWIVETASSGVYSRSLWRGWRATAAETQISWKRSPPRRALAGCHAPLRSPSPPPEA